ncbi:MAG TPA: hypothetical protein ENI96_06000 [Sedimenticola thiotaurini]|uniref:DUF4124 domain-containing protein n=1 Tax=Sedimenticola thiotaurini TaxID=1543721 RepID=A0A831RIQ2_9GAMM|nr:hypothetical protein [Sedimenticola thiotaurini]
MPGLNRMGWRVVVLAWLPAVSAAATDDGGNWLQLRRLNQESSQQLESQQRPPRLDDGRRRALPGRDTETPEVTEKKLPPPQPDGQLYQQQRLQQRALQEQQRRRLITEQHRSQALENGVPGSDPAGAVRQQQFRMQQQNQLRGFQLQQQIQQGIRR